MPEIVLTYCKPCGYEKRAKAAADAVQEALGLAVTTVPGKAGIYEVRVGNAVVLKRTAGWMPSPADVVEAVRLATAHARS